MEYNKIYFKKSKVINVINIIIAILLIYIINGIFKNIFITLGISIISIYLIISSSFGFQYNKTVLKVLPQGRIFFRNYRMNEIKYIKVIFYKKLNQNVVKLSILFLNNHKKEFKFYGSNNSTDSNLTDKEIDNYISSFQWERNLSFKKLKKKYYKMLRWLYDESVSGTWSK